MPGFGFSAYTGPSPAELEEQNRVQKQRRRKAAEAEEGRDAVLSKANHYVARFGMSPGLALRRAQGGLDKDAWKGASGREVQAYSEAAGTPWMRLSDALRAYAKGQNFEPPPLHPILDQVKVAGLPVRTRFSDSCLLSEILPELVRDLVDGHRRKTMDNLADRRY